MNFLSAAWSLQCFCRAVMSSARSPSNYYDYGPPMGTDPGAVSACRRNWGIVARRSITNLASHRVLVTTANDLRSGVTNRTRPRRCRPSGRPLNRRRQLWDVHIHSLLITFRRAPPPLGSQAAGLLAMSFHARRTTVRLTAGARGRATIVLNKVRVCDQRIAWNACPASFANSDMPSHIPAGSNVPYNHWTMQQVAPLFETSRQSRAVVAGTSRPSGFGGLDVGRVS